MYVSDGVNKGSPLRTSNTGSATYYLTSNLTGGSNYKLYISLISGGTASASSNSAFTIKPVGTNPVPINGGWSAWSDYGSCVNGYKPQIRSCTNPSPDNGGASCVGSTSQTISCSTTSGVLTSVTISGTAQVGQTLRAIPNPANANVNYSWMRKNIYGYTSYISGATSSSYTLTNDDLGSQIFVIAKGTNGYTGGESGDIRANTSAVLPLSNTTPTITVLSPKGGETYKLGDKITIKWKTENIPLGVKNISINMPFSAISSNGTVGPNGGICSWTPQKDNYRTINDGEETVTFDKSCITYDSGEQSILPTSAQIEVDFVGEKLIRAYSKPFTITSSTTNICPVNMPNPFSLCSDGQIEPATKDINGCATSYKCTNPNCSMLTPTTAGACQQKQPAKSTQCTDIKNTCQADLDACVANNNQDATCTPNYRSCVADYNQKIKTCEPSKDQQPTIANDICVPTLLTTTLRFGATGAEVRSLQTILINQGYEGVTVDGRLGTGTMKALLAFQTAHGLTADGIIGFATRTKLNEGVSVCLSSVAPVIPVSTTTDNTTKEATLIPSLPDQNACEVIVGPMWFGMRGGDSVKSLQTLLNSLGYSVGVVDGIYGQGTMSAVRAFQSANGLTVDGTVGPITMKALNTSSCKASTGGTIPATNGTDNSTTTDTRGSRDSAPSGTTTTNTRR